jgi:hypothetical protein
VFDTTNLSTAKWSHAVALHARDMQRKPSQRFRERHGRLPRVADAGWHLAYQGDVDEKLSAFAHAEVDTDEYRVRLAASRAKRVDLDGVPFIDCPLTGEIAEVLRGIP